MAYIAFTDVAGFTYLFPNTPLTVAARAVLGRLRGWTPTTRVVGPRATALGTGLTYAFKYRTDYGASFVFPLISGHYHPSSASIPLEEADRLIAHMLAGGLASLYTEDNAGAVYTIALAPGAAPELRQTDPRLLEYELALSVLRADGVQAPMTCRYGRLT